MLSGFLSCQMEEIEAASRGRQSRMAKLENSPLCVLKTNPKLSEELEELEDLEQKVH